MLGGTARQSHPISDEDLDKKIPKAEPILKKVNGKDDIENIIRDLTPEEKFRTQPEELTLIYGVRTAVCLYLYFYELLVDRTELKKDVEENRSHGGLTTNDIQSKRKFISAYSLFVMASSITARCEKLLRGKDQSKLAHLESPVFDLVAGNGIETDLGYALSYYVTALKAPSSNEGKLIESKLDLISVSRDYWKAFALKATEIIKTSELLGLVATTTFTHGKFTITGLTTSDKQESKIITWAPVLAEEIIGDPDVTVLMERMGDRLALYDPVLQKNPFVYFGGLLESILFDGPPGTGKTTRMKRLMTKVAQRAQQVGLSYQIKSLTADQIKSEWYGKAAQLIAAILESIKDPTILSLFFVDDIDLLITGDRSSSGTNGADLDIMKALMDFFSGTGTNYAGYYLAVAATNKPTAQDEALRQRFVYPANILGPQGWEDFSDLAFQEMASFSKTGLLQVSNKGYEPKKRPLPTKISDIYPLELKNKYKNKKSGTWEDIGHLCAELHTKDPKFTGRSVKNAIQVAKARSADFDVPEEWFADPTKFRAKEWEERLKMVQSLYGQMTADQVMMSLEYQFEVGQRYSKEAFEKEVANLSERMMIQQEAAKRK